jgi:translation initiation factor 3 subunit C
MSGSEEDSDDDSEKQTRVRGEAKHFNVEDWDSSSDEKRVILTEGEKLTQQLMDVCSKVSDALERSHDLKTIPDGVDTSNWPTVPLFSEAKSHVEAGLALLIKYKKGVKTDGVPGFFVRSMSEFASTVSHVAEVAKKDKSFAAVIPKDVFKQMSNVARFAATQVVDGKYKALVKEYRAKPSLERWQDPLANIDSEDELSDEDEKDKVKSGPKRGTREFWVKQPGETSSDEEDENDSWLDDSGESGDEEVEKKVVKAKPGAKTKKHKEKVAAVKEEGETDDEDSDEVVQTKSNKQEPLEEEKELKAEDVDRLTLEMSQLRGRKGTDYPRLLQRLELIVPKAKTDVQRIRLLILFVNTRFDSVKSTKARLSAKDWRVSVDNIRQILNLLHANPTYRLVELDDYYEPEIEGEEAGEGTPLGEEMTADKKKEIAEKNKGVAESEVASGKVVISGSLFALLERLDSAFVRTLQQIDPHTQEYVTRLSDDPEFVNVAKDMLAYQVKIGDHENSSRTAHAIISHMYFKSHAHGAAGTKLEVQNCSAALQEYAKIVYDHGTPRHKAQAMLMCIYHYALMDNFAEARDRMLMSHLQDKAILMDIETQILFNRTNVQIGLCAFRAGLIREAHSALSEIYSGGRVKELLAQGTSSQRYQDKDKEMEKVEKSRMMPFHMHINLELLETCHLIAAMMLEVPAMASERYSKGSVNQDNKVMSKYLRKLVDYHERQVFAGPPETTRDFVVAAARALSRGNWKKTQSLLLNMPAWELLEHKDKVKAMLSAQLQEVGLKTYLFTYCHTFETLSISMLAEVKESSFFIVFFSLIFCVCFRLILCLFS